MNTSIKAKNIQMQQLHYPSDNPIQQTCFATDSEAAKKLPLINKKYTLLNNI